VFNYKFQYYYYYYYYSFDKFISSCLSYLSWKVCHVLFLSSTTVVDYCFILFVFVLTVMSRKLKFWEFDLIHILTLPGALVAFFAYVSLNLSFLHYIYKCLLLCISLDFYTELLLCKHSQSFQHINIEMCRQRMHDHGWSQLRSCWFDHTPWTAPWRLRYCSHQRLTWPLICHKVSESIYPRLGKALPEYLAISILTHNISAFDIGSKLLRH